MLYYIYEKTTGKMENIKFSHSSFSKNGNLFFSMQCRNFIFSHYIKMKHSIPRFIPHHFQLSLTILSNTRHIKL